eukprot:COSAG05_NODE_214_length_13907_cov_28.992178_17_plen_126_part_00
MFLSLSLSLSLSLTHTHSLSLSRSVCLSIYTRALHGSESLRKGRKDAQIRLRFTLHSRNYRGRLLLLVLWLLVLLVGMACVLGRVCAAVLSFVLVLCYTWFHTTSLALSIMAMLMIALSFPVRSP